MRGYFGGLWARGTSASMQPFIAHMNFKNSMGNSFLENANISCSSSFQPRLVKKRLWELRNIISKSTSTDIDGSPHMWASFNNSIINPTRRVKTKLVSTLHVIFMAGSLQLVEIRGLPSTSTRFALMILYARLYYGSTPRARHLPDWYDSCTHGIF